MEDPPFRLLEYDAEQGHGQIWLKYRIHRSQTDATPENRGRLRVVLYLPVAEEEPLDLLAEYRMNGVVWRIGGKKPTLFSFLKSAGVALPEGPGDQRRLWEGGADSILAKYVLKFIDQPAVFWESLLTPEVAQSRLIGDIDRTILEIASDPDTAWSVLREKGLIGEFLALVKERYGIDAPADSPAAWMREVVAVLALTETYVGYHEASDFPFLSRLPPLALRPHHVQLLHHWLRDSEARPAWDRWITEAETHFDLTQWATNRPPSGPPSCGSSAAARWCSWRAPSTRRGSGARWRPRACS
jgi:hypothetical protein